MSLFSQPTFRLFFALQQSSRTAQARFADAKIYTRFHFDPELRVMGSFTQFVELISSCLSESLQAYAHNHLVRLVFLTADYEKSHVIIRIIDGAKHRESSELLKEPKATLYRPSYSIAHVSQKLWKSYRTKIEMYCYPNHGRQLKLMVPIDTQSHDRS